MTSQFLWVVEYHLGMTVPRIERFAFVRYTKATYVVRQYGGERTIRLANGRRFFLVEAEMRTHVKSVCQRAAGCYRAQAKEADEFSESPTIREVPAEVPKPIKTS